MDLKNKKIKTSSKKKVKKSSSKLLCLKKNKYYQNIIQDTILYVQKYKTNDVIDAGELNICIKNMEELYKQTNNINILLSKNKKVINFEDILNKLQKINNDLSTNFRLYGTKSVDDLLTVCFGTDYTNQIINENNKPLYDVIKKYTHPISYKLLDWKPNSKKSNKQKLAKNRIVEDYMLVETADSLDCFDLARTTKKFQTKVYGIKIVFQNKQKKKTMVVSALTDDMVINCMNLNYLSNKLSFVKSNRPNDPEFKEEDFNKFCEALTLKELLVYNSKELYHKFLGHLNQNKLIKKKTISQIVKEFISGDLFTQRKTLTQLLLKHNDPEFQYLAYLLYDLLSNDTNGSYDTLEQTVLFDSLPWAIKKFFRDAMKTTIKYTKTLSNFDTNKIPIEQQICLMKVKDTVKEKAMLKLKEVKAKSEDSGSKARQYLEGLLKIPFGIYKKEKILSVMEEINTNFKELVTDLKVNDPDLDIPNKKKYSSIEIEKHIKYLKHNYLNQNKEKFIKRLIEHYTFGKRDILISNVCFINSITKRHNFKKLKILHSGKKNQYMKDHITLFFKDLQKYPILFEEFLKKKKQFYNANKNINLVDNLTTIENKWKSVNNTMSDIKKTLDDAVYGHFNAKRQIERVIGQWITGKQSGYCFGFEGSPGIGKTSMARKGLAYCLKDHDSTTRPFAFIALGGSSNASTLSGHNYTYVGSTWGRIVDILIEKKCMNPIIFIDELDKVSKTENGKEIIGILTHLIDPTQNEGFQDKYFSGIDLDLSKALFIFSYNDVSAIDKILLDRIHRIKFDNLTLYDKLEIVNNYILPELYKKVGLEDMLHFDNDVLKFIIENYTYESGVRKLKEILFEIISEINLEILNHKQYDTVPINITIDDVKFKYLKERNEIIKKKIHVNPTEGIINGLWANSLGMGGIIPIECFFLPSNNFLDLKLTGLQGDVMKESMNVAKTLAWKITPSKKQQALQKKFDKTKLQGIHIHCPEGATPKDGPSAGTAITVCIYSLLNNLKINNKIAITGEINLQGQVSAIGGLELKILGGIKAGVETFIFPDENKKDYDKFIEKYNDKNVITENISFHSVSNIHQVLDIVFSN